MKKRNAAFFVSDVNDCVDYVEAQAQQHHDAQEFKRAVVNKLAATYVFGDINADVKQRFLQRASTYHEQKT